MKHFFPLPFALFFVAALTASVRSAEIAATVRWQVVRNTANGAATALSDDAQQRIAGRLGTGHFVVTDHTSPPAGGRPPLRVLFFFPSEQSKTELRPVGRVWILPDGAPHWCDGKEEAAALAEGFGLGELEKLDDAAMTRALPELVCAALYGGNARIVPPVASRTAEGTGTWTWRGRFVLGPERAEDVTLVRRPGATSTFDVQRMPVAATGISPASTGEPAITPTVDQWAVTEAPKWRLRQRYQLGLTLANLRGDARRKYQIGAELLQESDPGAKSLGLRLVKEASAAGYTDAANLLATLESGPRRPESDRDRERPER
jgi:hypothetical protein